MGKCGLFATALIIAVLHLSSAREAAAQPYRYGVGWTAGNTFVTELNSDRIRGTLVDDVPLSPGLGLTFGLHGDRWFHDSRRLGVRVQGFYEMTRLAWRDEWRDGTQNVHVGSGDVSALFRLREDASAGILPFISAGAGLIWYDIGSAPLIFDRADAFFDGESELLPLIAFGVGVDTPPFWTWDDNPVRIRFELGDRLVFRSPLERLSDGDRHGLVHDLRFTFGMYSSLDDP